MITEFSRTEMLIGPEAVSALKHSTIVIFGVGGVGSHAIEALARSGAGRLVLIDNDTVSLTNINRQSIALHSTIGQYKTQVMAKKIHDICPHTSVHTFEEFVLPNTLEGLFERILSLPAPDEDKTGAGTAHSTEQKVRLYSLTPLPSPIFWMPLIMFPPRLPLQSTQTNIPFP